MPCNVSVRGAFQLTPSARRATTSAQRWSWPDRDFNPRPPRGERPFQRGDKTALTKFQSTPSARRATRAVRRTGSRDPISIHALREEGDHSTIALFSLLTDFNPRPPRGGRLRPCAAPDLALQFQSTPSARRATPQAAATKAVQAYFNPRPPRGGRPRCAIAGVIGI